MTIEQMEKAIIEITLGFSFEDSSITPKNKKNKKEWDALEAEIREAENEGYIIDIPSDFP